MKPTQKERMLSAIEGVLKANSDFREMVSDVGAEDDEAENVKEKLETIGALVGAFIAIDIAMKKLRAGVLSAKDS